MKKNLLLLSLLVITNFAFAKQYIANFEFNGNANDQKGKIQTEVHGATLTTDRHGRKNRAYEFDGENDYMTLPSGIIDLDENKSFSIETYLFTERPSENNNQTNAQERATIFSLNGFPLNGTDLLLLWVKDGSLSSLHNNNVESNWNIQNISVSSEMIYNKYHHLVLVKNGNKKKISLYLDGKLIGEKQINMVNPLTEITPLIGAHHYISAGATYTDFFFKGKIDYLRIYSNALSPKRIKKMYRRESRAPYKHEYKSKNECEANKHHTDKINASIKVFPNPSRGHFKITTDAGIDCKEVRIYNHHGKVVMRSSFKREFNACRLKPGYYTVVLITPYRNYKRRLVIVR
ncbi:MAG: hypothetical protein ACJAZ2_000700 [Glaciecola sp.]|jgi:hypothetical protein